MPSKTVYFDNSATTAVAPEVLDAMIPFLKNEYGNPSSIHFMGGAAAKAVVIARKQVADSIRALPSQIVFTSGGTEADNMAIIGTAVATKAKDPKRKRIITTSIEHEAVLEACEELKRRGFKVTIIPVDGEGFVDIDRLEKEMKDDVSIVSVMAANNVIGTIQDIKTIGSIAHEYGAFFHTDAVQAYTKMDLDVKKNNIDLLSVSGHKVHGPKGIGALFINKGVTVSPIIFGGGQESGLRSSTENVPGIIGLGKAAEIAMKTMDKDVKSMTKLRDEIIDDTLGIDGAKLNGPTGSKRICNNTHFRFEGLKGKDAVIELSNAGIAVSAASACSAGSSEPSYVLAAIGLSPQQSASALRISLSRYNSEDDVKQLSKALRKIIC